MQERLCREYAERNNMKFWLCLWIEENQQKQQIVKNFLRRSIFVRRKKGAVDFFIVYKLDRFARNHYDHAMAAGATLKKFSTALRSVTEPIDDSSTGLLMEGVLSSFAEFDNNVRTERTKSGMLESIKKGIWVWQAPIGYYQSHRGSNIVPDPKIAPYIRLIFEEWAKGIHSYDSLAKFIGKRGFRTRHNKPPFPQLIEKIIKNEIYAGIIDVWGFRIEGDFEAIISRELFERSRKKRKGDGRSFRRQVVNEDFPLRRSMWFNLSRFYHGE